MLGPLIPCTCTPGGLSSLGGAGLGEADVTPGDITPELFAEVSRGAECAEPRDTQCSGWPVAPGTQNPRQTAGQVRASVSPAGRAHVRGAGASICFVRLVCAFQIDCPSASPGASSGESQRCHRDTATAGRDRGRAVPCGPAEGTESHWEGLAVQGGCERGFGDPHQPPQPLGSQLWCPPVRGDAAALSPRVPGLCCVPAPVSADACWCRGQPGSIIPGRDPSGACPASAVLALQRRSCELQSAEPLLCGERQRWPRSPELQSLPKSFPFQTRAALSGCLQDALSVLREDCPNCAWAVSTPHSPAACWACPVPAPRAAGAFPGLIFHC